MDSSWATACFMEGDASKIVLSFAVKKWLRG